MNRVYIVTDSEGKICGVYKYANNALHHKYMNDSKDDKMRSFVSVWDVLDGEDIENE